MKKSEIYHAAMVAVIEYGRMNVDDKVTVLSLLKEDKDLAVFQENREAKSEG